MTKLSTKGAIDLAARVLGLLGAPDDSAAAVGEWLVNADLAGHPSHGIIRLTDYSNRKNSGDLDPAARPQVRDDDGGSAILVDGNRGFGHLAAHLLTETMVERTADRHVVMGGIVNASHTGRLGEWAEQAVRSGVILYMCTAQLDKTNVAAYGAREGHLGTNPMTIGIPGADGDSLMLDYATSKIAGGKIQHLIDVGGSTPPDSLIDKDGNPSTNPQDWLEGGLLLPFGGHKGYGLALVISILGGCVVGQMADDVVQGRGVFALAIDPAAFADRNLVLESVRRQLELMRQTAPAPGFERVEVPGDFERRNRSRFADSFEIPEATWNDILDLGEANGGSRDEMSAMALIG